MMNQTASSSPALDNDLILFALNSSRGFGEEVSRHLGHPLSNHEEREFDDGEHKARPLVNVRGKDVYVIQSLYGDDRQSGNDKLCRLLFFIGTLKDAAACRVTAVVPYLAYARKDRKTQARDPVTTRYVAALFEAVGTDVVVTMDVHNLAAFQNAFRCRTENLEANKLFVDHFAPLTRQSETVVVSPDAGGIKRADRFRRFLSRKIDKPIGAAFAEKYRSLGVLSGEAIVGEVKGRDAIIIDDLISTGGTIVRTANACRALGATGVYAAATHGLFVSDADTVLADAALDGIVIADTVEPLRLRDGPVRSKLAVLNGTALFAKAIHRLHADESISDLFE